MHVLQPFTDLPYEQHRVQLGQVVVLIDDAVKQLASLHTKAQRRTQLQPGCCIETDIHMPFDRLTIP